MVSYKDLPLLFAKHVNDLPEVVHSFFFLLMTLNWYIVISDLDVSQLQPILTIFLYVWSKNWLLNIKAEMNSANIHYLLVKEYSYSFRYSLRYSLI